LLRHCRAKDRSENIDITEAVGFREESVVKKVSVTGNNITTVFAFLEVGADIPFFGAESFFPNYFSLTIQMN
jgi:hypothetical protein